MIEVEGPDGAILEFSPDTPRETMKAAMQKRYGQPEKSVPERSGVDNAADIGATVTGGILEGIPVVGPLIRGGIERAAAATDAAFSDRTYDQNMAFLEKDRARMKAERPGLDTASQVGGAVAATIPLAMAAPLAMGVRGASTGAKMAAGASSGAAISGTDAAVRSGGDTYETAKGAALGLGLGAAAPALARGVGAVASAIGQRGANQTANAAIANAPTSEAIKAASSQLYDQARAAGLVIRPAAFDQFARKLSGDLTKAGANASIHPKAAGFVSEVIGRLGKSQSLDDLDALRQLAGDVAGAPDAAERRLGSIIKEGIDDWMERLSPLAVESGDKSAVKIISEARQLWGQARRGEVIEKIMRDAQQSASGVEAGIRNGFRALSKNDKALRGFSEIEKRAIRAVAQGTPTERVLRLLGKSAPTGIVSTALSAALGGAAGGPVGALALPAAGHIVKRGADRMTRQAAERAGGVVRMGRQAQAALPLPRPVDQDSIGKWSAGLLLGPVPAVNR